MRNRQKAELAAEVMGVSLDGLTSKTLGEAYKEKIRIHHPDAGGEHEDFIRIQHAKKDLLAWLDGLRGSSLDGSASMSSSSVFSGCERCEGKAFVTLTRGFTSVKIACPVCQVRTSNGG